MTDDANKIYQWIMIFNSDAVVEYELLELDTDSIGTLQLDSSIQLEVDFTIAREARSLRYFMLDKPILFELVVIFWSNNLLSQQLHVLILTRFNFCSTRIPIRVHLIIRLLFPVLQLFLRVWHSQNMFWFYSRMPLKLSGLQAFFCSDGLKMHCVQNDQKFTQKTCKNMIKFLDFNC